MASTRTRCQANMVHAAKPGISSTISNVISTAGLVSNQSITVCSGVGFAAKTPLLLVRQPTCSTNTCLHAYPAWLPATVG